MQTFIKLKKVTYLERKCGPNSIQRRGPNSIKGSGPNSIKGRSQTIALKNNV